MATKAEIIAKAKAAILDFDEEAAEEVANESLKAGIDPAELIQDGFTAAMTEVGDQFEAGTLFLPHVIAASKDERRCKSVDTCIGKYLSHKQRHSPQCNDRG